MAGQPGAWEADVSEPTDQEQEEPDFWELVGLHCVGYNSQIDEDALAVLKGIAVGKYCTDIANELGLPAQYVELLQSIFCSADWCEYGTSPRGCWINPKLDAGAVVDWFEGYVQRQWRRDGDAA
jgi:hypothetical protein